jgi:hypothetical protein
VVAAGGRGDPAPGGAASSVVAPTGVVVTVRSAFAPGSEDGCVSDQPADNEPDALHRVLGIVAEAIDVLDEAFLAAPACRPTCPGCGSDNAAYMVNDYVWAAAGVGDGWWCVTCIEDRLGRELTGADLKVVPMNVPFTHGGDDIDPRQLTVKVAAIQTWTVDDWATAHQIESGNGELTEPELDT